MKIRSVLLLFIGMLISAACVRAEAIVTKNDIVIEGRILMECEGAVLIEHTGMGAITVPHYKIKYLLGKGALIEEAERVIREENRARREMEEAAKRKRPTITYEVKKENTETPAPEKPLVKPLPLTPPAGTLPTNPIPNGQPKASIPANEAAAVASCKVFLEAQERYHRKDWDGDKILEYAQSLKGDFSLFETKAGAADIRLIDQAFADAEGDPTPGAPAKSGYRFKILTGQGASAFGGQKSYLVTDNGKANMTLGYALLAYPAEYGKTGNATFLISIAGVIWRKDLGTQTSDIVRQLKEFNPDKTWTVVE
jgi:hypothetical protein